jgi:diguanylate cyclase (GGDEF)-like protein
MTLDVLTVFFAMILVAITCGLLMIFAGRRSPDSPSLTWWGAGNLVAASGAALIAARGNIPDVISIGLANALLALSNGMFWNSGRLFRRRETMWLALAIGPALWFAACLVPPVYNNIAPRIILSSLIVSVYTFATVYEFWHIREPLVSKKAAAVLLTLHGTFYAVRGLTTVIYWPTAVEAVLVSPWVISMAIVSVVHLVAMSVLLIGMSKERTENIEREAASTDTLTGIPNRRYFMQEATRRLNHCAKSDTPAAVLMIDLDNFKGVNDRHGHATGDTVLRAVAEAIVDNLRPDDLAGRIGGDEFVCCLTRCSNAEAYMIAERLMDALREPYFEITISIGIATAKNSGYEIDTLLRDADRSMYRAKNHGKDRIVVH